MAPAKFLKYKFFKVLPRIALGYCQVLPGTAWAGGAGPGVVETCPRTMHRRPRHKDAAAVKIHPTGTQRRRTAFTFMSRLRSSPNPSRIINLCRHPSRHRPSGCVRIGVGPVRRRWLHGVEACRFSHLRCLRRMRRIELGTRRPSVAPPRPHPRSSKSAGRPLCTRQQPLLASSVATKLLSS